MKKKSGLNAHVHKENPGNQHLNDIGEVDFNKDNNHIGVKNPSALPVERGRAHGHGT